MKCGGSLSHHHGVGKLRKGYMDKALGQPALTMLRGLQNAVDPKRIMANSNLF
jgi:alkyldihydroxyacetonephosphate synthase